jgi:hypothetical protein
VLEQWLGIGTATSVQTLKTPLDTVVRLNADPNRKTVTLAE